jgi:hypothetical protein
MTGAGKPLALHTSVMLSCSDTELLLFSNGLIMMAGAAMEIRNVYVKVMGMQHLQGLGSEN